jgi:hypothetical protein
MMRICTVGLQIVSALAGLYAAYCWWIASASRIDPAWIIEPGETELSQAGRIGGLMNSVVDSARLNKRAAVWTAVAVLFGAVSSIFGVLAG